MHQIHIYTKPQNHKTTKQGTTMGIRVNTTPYTKGEKRVMLVVKIVLIITLLIFVGAFVDLFVFPNTSPP